ncbi:hypothetical protein LGL08_11840 [Clostridium estertheticum]|uniref:hypothetical protein n=1 Tax=Clostridium estertheticum TaxID=238834 RepID=UPI001CF51550|nr:hypothetical protein [Clostridium estertheticum]MCB2306730.1 hypothetical protein [Clostridium estertheticum]MCB2346673.1 hypothetical protein [Clostridium estertheticum]MCB2350236.1 hypothetical protein [Clostridium estertheticum]WAG47206.1 hypothetical protein LL127_07065 [Clostridium estertheticum]
MGINKNSVNTGNKRKNFKLILFLSIIIISTGIFLICYYSSITNVYSSYKTSLITNINGINDVNKNVSQFNSNKTIDVDYAKKQLPKIINDLSVFKANLSNSQPTTKYKKDNDNLKSGLDKNLLIYRQTLAILNNPSGNDVETSMENLKTFRNDCINFYSLIDVHNASISLPKISLTFIDNILDYSDTAVMIKKETVLKSRQNQEFISDIDGLSTDFLSIKSNLYSYTIKVRKKEMSYYNLSKLVNDDFSKLNNLQNTFKILTVPTSAIPTYESFKILLDKYESYLSDFKITMTNENSKASNASITPKVLESLYTSSNTLFNDVETSYANYIKSYTELKNQ